MLDREDGLTITQVPLRSRRVLDAGAAMMMDSVSNDLGLIQIQVAEGVRCFLREGVSLDS